MNERKGGHEVATRMLKAHGVILSAGGFAAC
jgi:hypothetical protein